MWIMKGSGEVTLKYWVLGGSELVVGDMMGVSGLLMFCGQYGDSLEVLYVR